MKIKKICEYLCDIGLLGIKDINYFLKIYSQIDNNKCRREVDKLKISLFSYINSISKDDKLLFQICRNIIDSFVNSQIVLKYKALNSINNIFKNKISILYNRFFCKLSINILKKKKNKFIVQPVYYKGNKKENNNNINHNKNEKNKEDFKDNIIQKKPRLFTIKDISNDPKDRLTAEDVKECTFAPCVHNYRPPDKEKSENNENVQSYTYYSPKFNIQAKMAKNKNKKNHKNSFSKANTESINLTNFSENQSNVNYLGRCDTYNDNRKNKFNKTSFSALDIHNFSPQIKNDYIYDNNFLDNNYLFKINNNENPINKNRAKTPRQAPINSNEIINNFLLKQDKHVKDVEKKILSLKLEQRNKEEKECSFSPEIHYYNNNGQNRYNTYLQNLNNYYDNYSSYPNNISNNNSNNYNINSNRNTNIITSHYNYSNRSNGMNICPKFEGALSPQEDMFTKELYNLSSPQSNKSMKRPNSVSQDFFEKLSNENNDKNERIEELRKKIENFDFSPKIEYNDKYKIKGSFEERQTKFIENKKKLQNEKEKDGKMFVDEMNKMYMNKRKTKAEDIVKKLYNKDEIDKIKKRNNKEENKKKKKNIINWTKRFKENNKNSKKNSKVNIYEFSKNNKIKDDKNKSKDSIKDDTKKENK